MRGTSTVGALNLFQHCWQLRVLENLGTEPGRVLDNHIIGLCPEAGNDLRSWGHSGSLVARENQDRQLRPFLFDQRKRVEVFKCPQDALGLLGGVVDQLSRGASCFVQDKK